MPAVDIEVEYVHRTQTSVDIMADTERGSVRVGSRWGASPKLRTIVARVDDAWFGGRPHEGRGEGVDGFDLRLNGANEDWFIRRITVRGYDLKDNPDLPRLIRLTGVQAVDRPVFLYQQQEAGQLTYQVRNIAGVAVPVRAMFELRDRSGQSLAQHQKELTLAPTSVGDFRFDFKTEGWPYGVYDTEFSLIRENDALPLLVRRGTIGVRSDTELRKAKTGEYRFGLDPVLGMPHRRKELMAWMQYMGVDIVRLGVDASAMSRAREAIAALREQGMEVVVMLDVPKDTQRPAFLKNLERVKQQAAALAMEMKPLYWELGNEPDLPFFYSGSIEQYVEGYHALYDAIKAADPQAVVMNGGLANAAHVAESNKRVRRFIELVDPARLDMLAYHAHGVGIKAERDAYQRMQRIAQEFDKGHLPLVDTESGVAARSAEQEQMQAATAIQKIIFSQSKGQPWLLWFRLLFEEAGSYGNLITLQEPRPVVLAYRGMVETLRGRRFVRMLDLGDATIEAYLFADPQDQQGVLVAWCNEPTRKTVYLRTAGHVAMDFTLEQLDMFGNEQPVNLRDRGMVEVVIGQHPTFIRWSAGGVNLWRTAPQAVRADTLAQLTAASTDQDAIQITNPLSRKLEAELRIQATSQTPVTITPASITLNLEPGQIQPLPVRIEVGPLVQPIVWPQRWTIFLNVSPDTNLAGVDAIPSTLGGAKAIALTPINHTLDFFKACGPGWKVRERSVAVAMAMVESDREQTVTLGASADWWMQWFGNGEPVYDTLASGNGGGFRITDHTFPVTLQAGRHLLAVRVLSGSHGWKLLAAPPRAVMQALTGSLPLDRLEFELVDRITGNTLMRQAQAIEVLPSLPRWSEDHWLKDLSLIEASPAATTLGEAQVTNRWVEQPETSRWWQGETDLSARMWLGRDAEHLYIVAVVEDQSHQLSANAQLPQQGDALMLAVANEAATLVQRWTLQHDSRSNAQMFSIIGDQGSTLQVQTQRLDNQTIYRMKLLRTTETRWLNLRISDADESYLKQYLDWKPGWENDGAVDRWYRWVGQPSE